VLNQEEKHQLHFHQQVVASRLGGNQKTKAVSLQNAQVLEALTELTDVNYGWDQSRWHLWFLNQGVPSTIDIRRDM
jgi:hypothetical protein